MSTHPTHAMILAAGLGKRMRPLTNTMPKPMIEVAGRSMIDRMLDELEHFGINQIVVNMSYMADVLEAHLIVRGVPSLIFSREDSPLETGGGVKKALHLLGNDPFFVLNGDIVCISKNLSFLERLSSAWSEGLDALLLLHPVERAIGYEGKGDFNISENGLLQRPGNTASFTHVFTGIQILHPRIFQNALTDVFSLNVLYADAMQSTPPRIKGIVHDGDWLHIGDPTAKLLAEKFLTTAI